MAIPSSREDLKQYCLRSLGFPVIEINVDDDQLEDRIDEALQYFQEYHFDGVEKIFLKHQMTSDDISNEYISINEAVIGITRIFPITSDTSGTSNMFDVRYQFHLNDLYNFTSESLINYQFAFSHLSLLNQLFYGLKPIRFNRHSDKLFIDWDWTNDIKADQYIVIEAYRILDPNTYTDVYNDMFLKKYTTALFKRQWGANLIKFEGIQLPGGVTLNGRQIFDDATEEIRQIEEEMDLKYQLPNDFIMG